MFPLELLVKSTLVIGAALAGTWFMRRSSAASRHLWLTAAALALLVLPGASLVLPSWNVFPVADPFVAARDFAIAEAESPPAGPRSYEAPRPTSPETGPRWWVVGFRWFVIVWIAGGTTLLLRLVGGKIYTQRVAATAPPVTNEAILETVRRTTGEMNIPDIVPVVESDHLDVPFVCGLLRPRLIVPPGFEAWPDDRVEAVLRHELGHVKRMDVLVQFFAQVACCLFWVNPLTWILERRLLVERERACDDIALGRETRGSDYAAHLMAVAEELGEAGNRVWVVSSMAEGTDFKDRILSALDPGARRTAPGRRHAALVFLVTLVLLLPLAAMHPTSQAARTHSEHPEVAAGSDTEALIASLGVSDADIREHAASALGKSGDPRAVPALIDVLDDRDASVREHAASALGRLGDPSAVQPLANVLSSDPEPRVREHAASALGKLGPNDDAYDALVEAYESDADVRVRAHAAFGLGLLGDTRAFDLLVEGLDSDHAEIRRECVEALGWLGDPRAVQHLEPFLESSDARIRQRAQKALQMLAGI